MEVLYHYRSYYMRDSRSTVRLICCLLAYVLIASLLTPPSWRSAASSTSPGAAGKVARAVKPWGGRSDAPSRAGEVLVRFGVDVTERGKDDIASSRGVRRKGKLRGESLIERLEVEPGQDSALATERLRRQPGVEFVEPNFLVGHDQVTPNDARFVEQWALRNSGQNGGAPESDVRAPAAWQETVGTYSTVIAVVDSGIDFTHPDLSASRWVNAGERADNGLDDERDGYPDDVNGWDWVANSGVVRDEAGHGTAVAGIIGAEGDNGRGISGVMWRASLMSLRVLDSAGTGDVAAAVEAIDYAVAHGASVINCSWGTEADSQFLKEAIERAGRRGVVVVTSAGNVGRDIDTRPYYPASYDLPNLITVAASDGFDNLATFSNRGATRVAVAAPGVDILTTQAGGDYRYVSGTSASAPLVAGIAGLIKTVRPNANAAAVRTAVLDGARRVDAFTGKVSSGGVADAAGALAALRGNPYGSNGGNGNGNGNGNGQGQSNGRPYVPPALRHDNDHGRGKDKKGQTVTPPPAGSGAPGANLPNLDISRKVRTSSAPRTFSAPIQANMACADCDPSGGGGGGGDHPNDPYFATARTHPMNDVGDPEVDLGSRNFNWSLPLVSLPGRAGHDLSLSLYYNSLVWTKQGTSDIQYNADHGTPAPGFQLGLPRLQNAYVNEDLLPYVGSLLSASAYMLITPSGGRVEMRYSGTSGVYESADSTYTQLTFSNGTPVLSTTDGTQFVFGTSAGGGAEWRCTQIKDHNGNYISAQYATNGHLTKLTDTLGREVNFVYNTDDNLEQIAQAWGSTTHVYAYFTYGSQPLNLNFPNLSVSGVSGSSQTVLSSVVVAGVLDSYHFSYNSYGQVYQVTHKAPDGHELAHTRYNLADADLNAVNNGVQTDCPRFTARYDYAQDWYNGAEAVTTYLVNDNATWENPETLAQETGTRARQTAPDGTITDVYSHSSGWDAGLPRLEEVLVTENNTQVRKKWTSLKWTQDNTSLPYQQNPRVIETNVYDGTNRGQTTVEYNSGYGLPTTVREWGQVGGQMVLLRRTVTDYTLGSAYLSSRVIGLPWQKQVYDGAGSLVSKVHFYYDWDGGGDMFTDTPAAATQHDRTNYGPSYLAGRGNLSVAIRFDVNDPNNQSGTAQETKYRVNTTGSVVMIRDAGWHATYVGYADSFSDNQNRNTFAYPTTLTDAEGYSSTTQYRYEFGAVTRTHSPSSGTGAGITYLDVAKSYDTLGRTERVERFVGQASQGYRKFVYDTDYNYVHTYETLTGTTQADEFHSWVILDGAGRVRASASEHPGSTGGFAGRYLKYNSMGRLAERSNTIEIDQNWNPAGDDVLDTSLNTGGWRYTTQSYDWKGRPLLTTNTDGTTRVLDYGGCGCAGGEVATAQDEHGRQRRYTRDALGRLARVEELNWNGTVYTTTQYSYTALDQIKEINQQGQLRTFDYDGHGRLWHKTTPEQGQTTYTYYADDMVNVITDARGATATYSYTGRHQVSGVDYNAPQGSGAAQTTDVGYLYDAAGNRFWMTDGEGSTFTHYDALGRIDWEERNINSVGSYRLGYEYNLAGELKKITYPWQFGSVEVTYGYDKAGRLNSVGGSGYAGVTSYASGASYRAFGGVKGMSYGDGTSLSTAYDRRLRATKWDVAGVLGYKYYYDDGNERTGRVTFAQHITGQNSSLDRSQTASSLDHSYEYDHVGRLAISHAGAEARAAVGIGPWGVWDGGYSQGYDYDVWGNMTHRYGWGGEVLGGVPPNLQTPPTSADLYYTYATGGDGVVNNRRSNANFTYDNGGNLTFDGGQHFTYDVQGNQTYVDWQHIDQGYDGDGRRVRRTADNTNPVRYLRSSVLGGQVIAELDYVNGSWQWWRGYVYAGAGLLAVQQGGVFFVHEDPVTKSKRVTSTAGAVQSENEFDPFGAEAGGSNSAFQPRKFTTYERDPNGTDEAMFRRYTRWHARFDQPDPYDGSYDFADPQSFNRYSYTNNDPVNFTDPSGLDGFRTIWIEPGPPDADPRGLPGRGAGNLFDGVVAPVVPGDEGGGPGGEGPAGPWVNPKDVGVPPTVPGCDLKLAKLFGGPGAVVGSATDPGTLEFYKRRGRQPGDYLPRAIGHGPAPYDNPDPKSSDQGGIIHIYGNAAGTSMTTGLYTPPGGKIGPIRTVAQGNRQLNVTYPGGITIAFVHVIPFKGTSPPNSMGSVRIGNMGGPDSTTDPGYLHTHMVFFKGGARIDPRSLYCKEFGY
jgi:RHS repeat-associated protein